MKVKKPELKSKMKMSDEERHCYAVWHNRSLQHHDSVLRLLNVAIDLEDRAEKLRLAITDLNYNFRNTFNDHVGFEP